MIQSVSHYASSVSVLRYCPAATNLAAPPRRSNIEFMGKQDQWGERW
jgi:hypothetical protein